MEGNPFGVGKSKSLISFSKKLYGEPFITLFLSLLNKWILFLLNSQILSGSAPIIV